MALGNEEMVAVMLAVVGVMMSSTWSSTMGFTMIEPVLRATQYKSSEIPFSIMATILTQLQSMEARRARGACGSSKKAKSSNSADTNRASSDSSSSEEEEEEEDISSEEEESELSSSPSHTNGLSDDASDITSHVDKPTGYRKRKRDGEETLLQENIRKMLIMYEDYSVKLNRENEEQQALHQKTLATIKEVATANTAAIGRVADAIVQLAAVVAKRWAGSD